jgi:hypothetical protein
MSNPIDLSLQSTFDPVLEKNAFEIVAKDPNVDMVLIYLAMLTPRYKTLLKLQEENPKPIVLVSAIDVNVSADSFSKMVKRMFIHIRAKKIPDIINELNQKGISIHPNEHLAAKALSNIYQFYNRSNKSSLNK